MQLHKAQFCASGTN